MEATVPYEESGWYDGQVWIKPPEILLQDRLIGTYEIYPGLIRLQITLLSYAFYFLYGCNFNIEYLNYVNVCCKISLENKKRGVEQSGSSSGS